MSVLSLIALDGFIVVNKKILEIFGMQCALLLGELANEANYWETQGKLEDGFFYSKSAKLEKRTGLSLYQQVQAIKKLEQAGVLSTIVKGVPPTKYFKINEKEFLKALSSSNLKKFEI